MIRIRLSLSLSLGRDEEPTPEATQPDFVSGPGTHLDSPDVSTSIGFLPPWAIEEGGDDDGRA